MSEREADALVTVSAQDLAAVVGSVLGQWDGAPADYADASAQAQRLATALALRSVPATPPATGELEIECARIANWIADNTTHIDNGQCDWCEIGTAVQALPALASASPAPATPALDERARIVAWLRAAGDRTTAITGFKTSDAYVWADQIENGEHL